MKQFYRLTMIMVSLFFSFGFSMAQDTLSVSSLSKDGSTSTWHLLKQQGSVKIYYQYVDCESIEFINFKVENLSNQPATVSWNFQFLLNNSMVTTNPDDVNVSLTVGAQSSEFGACSSGQNHTLSLFLREPNSGFRMDNILITNFNITN
jgi:hypothetical protein